MIIDCLLLILVWFCLSYCGFVRGFTFFKLFWFAVFCICLHLFCLDVVDAGLLFCLLLFDVFPWFCFELFVYLLLLWLTYARFCWVY